MVGTSCKDKISRSKATLKFSSERLRSLDENEFAKFESSLNGALRLAEHQRRILPTLDNPPTAGIV